MRSIYCGDVGAKEEGKEVLYHIERKKIWEGGYVSSFFYIFSVLTGALHFTGALKFTSRRAAPISSRGQTDRVLISLGRMCGST